MRSDQFRGLEHVNNIKIYLMEIGSRDSSVGIAIKL
jgi:hypothetical protein